MSFDHAPAHSVTVLFQSCDKDGHLQYNSHAKPKADGLIIHIHGGGFVAQSSKSHEVGRIWLLLL